MVTVNSLSGGKTSSYVAANYKADYNVFALVRTSDVKCLFPDSKLRQRVSDKLGGVEFVGTLEEDMIIYTMFDLEQYIGREISWVSGKTFDEVIQRGKKKYLPNVTERFCTTEMKLKAIFDWWKINFNEPVNMQIGYRANETNRIFNMNEKLNKDGFSTFKDVVGHSKNGRQKWAHIPWQKPYFPLAKDGIFKDMINEFWRGKPVRFAYMNNCIGCFHRNPLLLKLMSVKFPEKFDWFVRQEVNTGYSLRTFKNGITYEHIRNHPLHAMIDFGDFDDFDGLEDCDSPYCAL
jgi:hypothetical protein